MSNHLSSALISALADGELSPDQLAGLNEHLAGCPQCTADALAHSLLKSATARAGQRYTPSPQLRERLTRPMSQQGPRTDSRGSERGSRPSAQYGWALAASLLLIGVGLFVLARNAQRTTTEQAALVTEVCDQHIATLAANAPPEVISSDRHTVKPWFQGKLPFSFNLPQNLPADTTLDGANLTYLHNQPTAQLLYSIGRHHVSVFVQQRSGGAGSNGAPVDHSGFHVAGFRTPDLEVVAVSDVDPARLSNLAEKIEEAQAGQH